MIGLISIPTFLLFNNLEIINSTSNQYKNSLKIDLDKLSNMYLISNNWYYLYSCPDNSLNADNWFLDNDLYSGVNRYSINNLRNYLFWLC